jgi:hypothetical protein
LLKACNESQYLGSVQFESSAFCHYIAANALGRSSGCVRRHSFTAEEELSSRKTLAKRAELQASGDNSEWMLEKEQHGEESN